MTNRADFSIKAGLYTADMKGGFEGIYQQNAKDSLGEMGKETFEAVNFLKQANPSQYKPENGAVYPNNSFGRSLQQIAQLIKANVGLEIAFTDTGNDLRWDTPPNEAGGRGQPGRRPPLCRRNPVGAAARPAVLAGGPARAAVADGLGPPAPAAC